MYLPERIWWWITDKVEDAIDFLIFRPCGWVSEHVFDFQPISWVKRYVGWTGTVVFGYGIVRVWTYSPAPDRARIAVTVAFVLAIVLCLALWAFSWHEHLRDKQRKLPCLG